MMLGGAGYSAWTPNKPDSLCVQSDLVNSCFTVRTHFNGYQAVRINEV